MDIGVWCLRVDGALESTVTRDVNASIKAITQALGPSLQWSRKHRAKRAIVTQAEAQLPAIAMTQAFAIVTQAIAMVTQA